MSRLNAIAATFAVAGLIGGASATVQPALAQPAPGPQCEPTSHMPGGSSVAGRPRIMRSTPAGSTSWKPGGTS